MPDTADEKNHLIFFLIWNNHEKITFLLLVTVFIFSSSGPSEFLEAFINSSLVTAAILERLIEYLVWDIFRLNRFLAARQPFST